MATKVEVVEKFSNARADFSFQLGKAEAYREFIADTQSTALKQKYAKLWNKAHKQAEAYLQEMQKLLGKNE